jgi:hypothetical protein
MKAADHCTNLTVPEMRRFVGQPWSDQFPIYGGSRRIRSHLEPAIQTLVVENARGRQLETNQGQLIWVRVDCHDSGSTGGQRQSGIPGGCYHEDFLPRR